MKIKILNRFDLSVIFECDADNMRMAIELAIKSNINLSRANLSGADLYGANLYGANLSGANLFKANLYGAYIFEANLYGAYIFEANLYGEKLDKTPIQLLGLKWDILITKKNIKIGCEVHTAEEWEKFKDSRIKLMNEEALIWWKKNKKMIMDLHKLHCGD